jgi:hypothetical protein
MKEESVVFCYGTRKELDHYLRIGGISGGWFSTNREWDPIGQAIDETGKLLLKQQTLAWGGGLIRIAVPADRVPYSWLEWKVGGFVDEAQEKSFDAAAASGSHREHWRFTKMGVSLKDWLAVEVDLGVGWIPHENFRRRH